MCLLIHVDLWCGKPKEQKTCTMKHLKDTKGSYGVSHVLELIPPICLLKYHQHHIHNWYNLLHDVLFGTEVIWSCCQTYFHCVTSRNVIIKFTNRSFFKIPAKYYKQIVSCVAIASSKFSSIVTLQIWWKWIKDNCQKGVTPL